jgi:HK97 gp10 family phage protein
MTTPNAPTVHIEGLAQLVRTLKRAGVDISDLKDAHRAAGDIVAREAEARAPRRSGALAHSIRAARQQGRARVQAGTSRVPYAGPIHWGWPARHIGAQPFVAEAAQATEPRWTAQYRADLEAALAKVKGV